MRISDWSSDVCSSDLLIEDFLPFEHFIAIEERSEGLSRLRIIDDKGQNYAKADDPAYAMALDTNAEAGSDWLRYTYRSEEHTSELQSLMRISYAVFCLKKKNEKLIIITQYLTVI